MDAHRTRQAGNNFEHLLEVFALRFQRDAGACIHPNFTHNCHLPGKETETVDIKTFLGARESRVTANPPGDERVISLESMLCLFE
jgi:hypothetical protein